MCKVKFNRRFFGLLLTFAVVLGMLPSATVSAYTYADGGYARVSDWTNVIGPDREVLAGAEPGEGVTVLYHDDDDMYYFIECSTPSGPVQGFVYKYDLEQDSRTVCAMVTTSSNTYYSPDTNNYAGSVDYGEYVAVLAKNDGWAYIEYNVSNAQRKRAYIPASYLSYYSSRTVRSFYHYSSAGIPVTINSYKPVYAGPNSYTYPTCGSVNSADTGRIWRYKTLYDRNGSTMYYVKYFCDSTNSYKYGYIYA